MSLMVSVSGVRGIVGKSLTPPTVMKYTEGFVRVIPGKKGNLSILLNTGELVRSHGIVNSVHEYKLVLKDYLKNGCTFLGVGIIHEFRYD